MVSIHDRAETVESVKPGKHWHSKLSVPPSFITAHFVVVRSQFASLFSHGVYLVGAWLGAAVGKAVGLVGWCEGALLGCNVGANVGA